MIESEPNKTVFKKIIGRKKNIDKPIGTESFDEKKNLVNITDLIRSVQRTEGNPDCFRKDKGGCDELECEWRPYCLEVLPTAEE